MTWRIVSINCVFLWEPGGGALIDRVFHLEELFESVDSISQSFPDISRIRRRHVLERHILGCFGTPFHYRYHAIRAENPSIHIAK
jgi:hypothetical protein